MSSSQRQQAPDQAQGIGFGARAPGTHCTTGVNPDEHWMLSPPPAEECLGEGDHPHQYQEQWPQIKQGQAEIGRQ
jgi:hypothetical protein